ncbi:MAG: GNAT family N-acetyltransferase [Gemmataceae bacterium]|nr:GNAT family N-acetyltransferase [Gemmataceae bacterium]
MKIDQVETERMILHRATLGDLADLIRFYADPQVMKTLGGLRTPDETRLLAEKIVAHWVVHNFGAWIMRDRGSGEFIGRGGLRLMVVDGTPEVELGYGLMPAYWGRGLATELARAAVRTAFEELRIASLCCFTLIDNAGSLNVMRKVGFQYERDGTYADQPHVFYRLRRPAGP